MTAFLLAGNEFGGKIYGQKREGLGTVSQSVVKETELNLEVVSLSLIGNRIMREIDAFEALPRFSRPSIEV